MNIIDQIFCSDQPQHFKFKIICWGFKYFTVFNQTLQQMLPILGQKKQNLKFTKVKTDRNNGYFLLLYNKKSKKRVSNTGLSKAKIVLYSVILPAWCCLWAVALPLKTVIWPLPHTCWRSSCYWKLKRCLWFFFLFHAGCKWSKTHGVIFYWAGNKIWS